jgi:S1-C subfamily serine protease
VATYADLSGYINTKRPNDKVQVTFIRDGKNKVLPVILSKNEFFSTEFKGMELENINANDKKKFNLSYGVKIKSITNENLRQYEDELKGNIILSIDNEKAKDVETVSKLLNKKEESQSVRIEMINKNGEILKIII